MAHNEKPSTPSQAPQKPSPSQPVAPEAGQAQRSHAQPRQAKAGQAKAGQAQAGQAKAGPAKATQAQAGQAQSGQAKAGQAKAGHAQPVPPDAGQAQVGQPQAGQSRTDQAQASQAQAQSATAPADQVQTQVDQALIAADADLVTSAENLQSVHKARLTQLNRTAKVFAARYGAKDPRTKTAQARDAAQTVTVARVAMRSQQISTPQPQVSVNGWALHGRVHNSSLSPVRAYTVFFVDAQNNYQQNYGFSYTDETGYFLLQSPDSANAAAAPQLFLAVVNNRAEPVLLSTTAFQPVTGVASYQNVTLPAGEPALGDPPPEIRKVAIPTPDKPA